MTMEERIEAAARALYARGEVARASSDYRLVRSWDDLPVRLRRKWLVMAETSLAAALPEIAPLCPLAWSPRRSAILEGVLAEARS